MKLGNQKTLSANLLKIGKRRVWFNQEHLQEIKEAITKKDIKGLVQKRIIQKRPIQGSSRFRARKRLLQRRKGRQKGQGTKKGSRTARLPRKRAWINRVRTQRQFLKGIKLKGVVSTATYRLLYLKIKGGYFRNRRHLKLYLTEHKLFQKETQKK